MADDTIRIPAGVRALWSAATRPSLPALGITLAVALCWFGVAAATLTPDSIGRTWHRYLAVDQVDEWTRIAGEAYRMRDLGSDRPGVVLFGSSSVRECLSSPGELQAMLADRTGTTFEILDVTAGALSPWEMSALLEHARPDFRGAVVIPLGMAKLVAPPSVLDLHRNSPLLDRGYASYDEECRRAGLDAPARTGVYLIDNHRFFVPRRGAFVRNVLRGDPPVILRHHFIGDCGHVVSMIPDSLRWYADEVTPQAYASRVGTGLAVIERILDRFAQNPDVRFVLMKPPHTSRYIADFIGAEQHAIYMQRVERFADERGLVFLNLNAAAALRDPEFRDWTHLCSKDAIGRATEAIADAVAEALAAPEPDAT